MAVFIVLDGGEGSGKSTMVRRLQAHFGERILTTREPGGSSFGERVRTLLLSDEASACDAETNFCLFWAARRDHVVHKVYPALTRGVSVICDRFDSSTWAYQIRGQEQIQLIDLFWRMRTHMIGGMEPDAYMLLDVDPRVGLLRARSRADEATHYDNAALDFHQRVRAGFHEFFSERRVTQHRAIINAAQPPEAVFAQLVRFVEAAME